MELVSVNFVILKYVISKVILEIKKKELQRSRVKYFIYLQTTMPQNLPEFQKSIGKELLTIKDRVRNLIGNAHRGEEGRYKESVLKKVIREYLPNNLNIWTWFIVLKNERGSYISTQIDILIYDNTYPTIFRDEDFVIITQDMVKAIIEVKSKTNFSENNGLKTIINKFERLESFEILKMKSEIIIYFPEFFLWNNNNRVSTNRIKQIHLN